MTTAPRETTSDLRHRMREDILSGRLTPGERLKFETLRDTYGASMGSLRETLTQIASEGLVIAEANRGFNVAPVSVSDLLDITELRVDLECKALISSIQDGGDEWEARIIAAFHLMQKLEPSLRKGADPEPGLWTSRHREFHEALVSACASPWVLRFRQMLFDQARRYRSLSMKHSNTPGRIEQHKALMDAVLSRDTEKACTIAESHIRDTAKNILQSMSSFQEETIKQTRA